MLINFTVPSTGQEGYVLFLNYGAEEISHFIN